MYKLFKEYFFESDERYSALLLLLGAILGVVALVAIMSMLAAWTVGFWAALTQMSYPLYIASLQTLLALTIGYAGINIFKDYLIGVLTINWREWLTKRLVNKYTSSDENNYLELERHPSKIDHPSQRIQEDVPSFVEQTLKLGIGLLQSILTFAMFIGNLWVLGGAATFAILGVSITIPGYLVLVAILFAAVTGLITHFIGRALIDLNHGQQSLEADFRTDMEVLSNHAESVAQDHGEAYFRQSLLGKLQSICSNAYERLHVNLRLTAFNSLYQQISYVFPYIVAAPLYFARQTTLGQLMDIAYSFAQIQYSLNWFSDSYTDLASYSTNVARIVKLENAMADGGLETTARSIVVQEEGESGTLRVQNLTLAKPSSTNHIMSELNLTFRSGENTLLKGPSGSGKSTLFKAIAGAWKYGSGDISVPDSARMCFLPQKPVLHNNTLKAILAYPQPVSTYTDEQYETVLRSVGGTDECIAELNTYAAWSKRLSPGEQQRISFARALLKRPDWLLLDEATSSMDEECERDMYNLIREQLTTTTFISIAHRSTVEEHHTRVVPLNADEQGRDPLRDTHAFFARRTAVAANDESTLLVNTL